MKRSRITALLALSISASLSCFYAGCGSSDDDIVTGVGGSGGAGGGGTGGSQGTGGGSMGDAKSDAVTDAKSEAAVGADAGADAREAAADAPSDTGAHLDAASDQRDAGTDAVTVDASADRASTDAGIDARVDAAPDVSVTPDSGPEAAPPAPEASVDSATLDAATNDAQTSDVVDGGAPEAEVDAGGGGPDAAPSSDGGSGEAGIVLCSDTSSTEACIGSLGPDCSQCATDNGCFDSSVGGGHCEEVAGTAPAACASPAGTSGAPTETQVCFATLQGILNSGCAATFQETPCLCGTADSIACTSGATPPLGPLLPAYQCELGATAPEILTNFTAPRFGAGKANAIILCLASLCQSECLAPR